MKEHIEAKRVKESIIILVFLFGISLRVAVRAIEIKIVKKIAVVTNVFSKFICEEDEIANRLLFSSIAHSSSITSAINLSLTFSEGNDKSMHTAARFTQTAMIML